MAEIGLFRLRVLHHHLQRGRDDEHMRRAVLNRLKHADGSELCLQQAAHSVGDGDVDQTRPANMRTGHGNKEAVIGLEEVPLKPRFIARIAKAKQVAVRQRRALRIARCARCIKLQDRIVRRRRSVSRWLGRFERRRDLMLGQHRRIRHQTA